MEKIIVESGILIALAIVTAWCVYQEARFWIMEGRHRKQLRELMDRHMSRNFGEYVTGQVAMGETKNATAEASAAALNEAAGDGDLNGLIDEEMGFAAHGPYQDTKGNKITPVT